MRSRALIATALAASCLTSVFPVAASERTATRRGVTDHVIRVGLHMPMTGAAPIPTASADRGLDVYWKWLKRRGVKIHGRYVRAFIKNDNYNPSQAVAVCKELVEEERVFLLAGIMQPVGATRSRPARAMPRASESRTCRSARQRRV